MYHRYSFAEATGKTELWRTLAHLNTRTGLDTTYQRVSPKTMDLVELFGRINPKTKEWQDGVFTGCENCNSKKQSQVTMTETVPDQLHSQDEDKKTSRTVSETVSENHVNKDVKYDEYVSCFKLF